MTTTAAFRELFTKFDHMIPMRDGVKLYTTLYVPKLVRLCRKLLQC